MSTNTNAQHVIFGTGPLGISVMHALRAEGISSIRMVNRSGKRGNIPQAVAVIGADAYDVEQVAQATQGAQVVYQCAQPEYSEWPEKFPPLQKSILAGTARNAAKLIVGDNLYMYGPTNGAPIHEGLPYNASGKKGRTRAQMAQAVLDAHQNGTVRAALARGSDFFGEAVLGSTLGERVFEPLLQGKAAQVFGSIDQPHTYTYIRDFGRAMVILGQREQALGRAWHVPNAETLSTRQVIERMAQLAGVEAQVSVMPRLMFEAVSLVHPILREFRENRYMLYEPYIVAHDDFVQAFGNIATPLDDALRNTIAWYRQHMGISDAA